MTFVKITKDNGGFKTVKDLDGNLLASFKPWEDMRLTHWLRKNKCKIVL